MRRGWPSVLAVILVLGAFGALALAALSSKNHDNKTSGGPKISFDSSTSKPKQACSIFTLSDAKKVLGATVKGGASPANGSSNSLTVSTCSYSQDLESGASTSAGQAATLLVRAPKTTSGAESNNNQFGPLRPADAVSVSGYGQSAYWDPQFGQLDILKNNTWYILSSGPLTPSSRTLDHTKQLADILIAKM